MKIIKKPSPGKVVLLSPLKVNGSGHSTIKAKFTLVHLSLHPSSLVIIEQGEDLLLHVETIIRCRDETCGVVPDSHPEPAPNKV